MKKILVLICAILVLTFVNVWASKDTFEFETDTPESTQSDEEAFVKSLNDNIGPTASYIDWYESANKEVQSAAAGFDGLIQSNQGNILSALIAQYLELMYKDAALCGVNQQNRNNLTNLSRAHTETKRQLLMNYPQEHMKDVVEILQKAREYYLSSKTRGAGFPAPCRKKIRSTK